MKVPKSRDYKPGHSVELIRSGKPYFGACRKVIDEAKYFIHFQTYIIDDDDTGRAFIKSLIRAARRGVKVYLLLDAFGGGSFSDELVNSIEKEGILFRKFSPAFITDGFHLSLRLHHKVLVADGEVVLIGGMNVANRYHGMPGMKEWLDFALLIKGPECIHALSIVKKLWNRAFIPRKERARETVHVTATFPENMKVRILQNNWYRNKIEILRSYRSALRHSKDRMIIFASYFLPGRNERRLLKSASRRGVGIKIILSANSDATMFKRATNFLYGFILRNNILIYEYLPSNLHAKVATVDGIWSTVGSYNLNHLSDYGSVEMNADILDEGFTQMFEQVLQKIIEKDCRQITFGEYVHRRTWIQSLIDWFSYQMIRSLMRIMFLMTARKPRPGMTKP